MRDVDQSSLRGWISMAWAMSSLKSSTVMVLSTLSMASRRTVLPFIMEMPMFTFSARSCSVNWKSPSVPEKSRMTMSG